ncbi:hypothetical protein MKP08_10235 [Erythrobacter sp. LQ02-29]|uniref:hypothetical protein n=1 Tax=unclassified Erythrobacter TaxID=2633097 RepID=UPI001BFC30B5|nr:MULTISPECIES: hypothetical protein [unclassified Erythrobacter]MCP9223127.1 hypothetical protein [Erythrobacter sp. LQ02-29]QWC55690.1 hypothetical protein F7D01_00115 [Erythrobacter sp. 3-20A1M]
MSTKEQRDALRAKIEAAEQRNADRSLADYARDATDKATAFVKEHPVATVAGVAVLGLAIGAMTRPGRRAGRRAGAMANYAAEMGLAYASGLFDSAGDAVRHGGAKLEDWSDDIAHSSRKAGRRVSRAAYDGRDEAQFAARKFARGAGRKYRDLRSRVAV